MKSAIYPGLIKRDFQEVRDYNADFNNPSDFVRVSKKNDLIGRLRLNTKFNFPWRPVYWRIDWEVLLGSNFLTKALSYIAWCRQIIVSAISRCRNSESSSRGQPRQVSHLKASCEDQSETTIIVIADETCIAEDFWSEPCGSNDVYVFRNYPFSLPRWEVAKNWFCLDWERVNMRGLGIYGILNRGDRSSYNPWIFHLSGTYTTSIF